jgi:ABC-type uncharacterized transport system substrate-binding protein
VFAIHGDPVGTGDVKSLARPGGNATGMSQTQGDLVPKLLGLLKETVPGLSRLAVLWNAAVKSKQHDWQEVKAAAPTVGIAVDSYEIRAPADFDGAFAAIAKIVPMHCWCSAIHSRCDIARRSRSLPRGSACRRSTPSVSLRTPEG